MAGDFPLLFGLSKNEDVYPMTSLQVSHAFNIDRKSSDAGGITVG